MSEHGAEKDAGLCSACSHPKHSDDTVTPPQVRALLAGAKERRRRSVAVDDPAEIQARIDALTRATTPGDSDAEVERDADCVYEDAERARPLLALPAHTGPAFGRGIPARWWCWTHAQWEVLPPATCSHGEPESECPSCAACAACRGECGVCPYVTSPGEGRA